MGARGLGGVTTDPTDLGLAFAADVTVRRITEIDTTLPEAEIADQVKAALVAYGQAVRAACRRERDELYQDALNADKEG